KTYTLPDNIRERLAKMRGETDIIIYLQHVSFGQRVELRQDDYDQAAEKVIAKKVEDLAEQFGDLGPRFHVHVLDTQQKSYQSRCDKINERSGEELEKDVKKSKLLKTIESAPENSVFFYSKETKRLQRLGFNDVFYLDKKASREANGGHGNL